jgi:hypothetical protein
VENVVEVRYAGVGVGRSTLLRDWTASGAFIGFAEPMPTGTPLVLKGDGIDQAARVVEVIESADPSVAGMRVEFVSGAEPVRPPPAEEPAPPPAAAAPVVPEVAPLPAPVSVDTSDVAEPPPVSAGSADISGVTEPPPVSAASPDASGVTEAQHPSEGEAGSNAGSGKRRRRRK